MTPDFWAADRGRFGESIRDFQKCGEPSPGMHKTRVNSVRNYLSAGWPDFFRQQYLILSALLAASKTKAFRKPLN